ncbi:hypothetical protein L5515_016465 [Caenorhabditis briggsae]|uniref:Uncharacterized protein n=1 Tax=Caenorhabditis briggsae TaxID=6238 RepID=A0AAE9FCW1_CAEBR|nr:hypothetical protein L5515_016465 [Caenorhabditis briggsae]
MLVVSTRSRIIRGCIFSSRRSIILSSTAIHGNLTLILNLPEPHSHVMGPESPKVTETACSSHNSPYPFNKIDTTRVLESKISRCSKDKKAWFKIPEDLIRRNADMTAFPNCVPSLIEKIRESSDTTRVGEAKLMTLLSKLRAMDLPILKADDGFNLFQKKLQRLAEHLKQAKANNASLNKAIAQHSAYL